jgi:predicted dehydrogenase
LRIAVVGAGAIGRSHIERILKSRDCELMAIVDPAPGASDLAAKLGVPLVASLPDLLKQRPDGVILASPNRLHVEQGLACVAAGVPALIEKPLADTVENGERLCQAAERAKVKLLTGHHRQHNPIMAKAVEIVKSGRLGRLVAVVGTEMFCKPDQYFEDGPWRRQIGGGPLLINMVHEIGNLRALCGEIVAVQTFASSATRNFPVEDTVFSAVSCCPTRSRCREAGSRRPVKIRSLPPIRTKTVTSLPAPMARWRSRPCACGFMAIGQSAPGASLSRKRRSGSSGPIP